MSSVATIALSLAIMVVIAFIAYLFLFYYGNVKTPSEEISRLDNNQYKVVSYDEIARDPNALKGQYLTFTGEIVQNIEDENYRVDVTETEYGGYTDTILVNYKQSAGAQRLLEGDIIKLYGRSDGFTTYVSVLKQKITIPTITVTHIERVNQ